MISKSETGYICHLEIYTGEGKKLQETILLVLQAYLHSQYHIYQYDYYNSMPTSEILLKNKSGVCGTIRQSWLPNQLKEKSKNLQRGEMTFFRKGEVILIRKYKRRLFCMMKTICDASIASTEKEDRRTGHQVAKPTCILESNKHMKGLIQSIPGNLQYLLENSKMV